MAAIISKATLAANQQISTILSRFHAWEAFQEIIMEFRKDKAIDYILSGISETFWLRVDEAKMTMVRHPTRADLTIRLLMSEPDRARYFLYLREWKKHGLKPSTIMKELAYLNDTFVKFFNSEQSAASISEAMELLHGHKSIRPRTSLLAQ